MTSTNLTILLHHQHRRKWFYFGVVLIVLEWTGKYRRMITLFETVDFVLVLDYDLLDRLSLHNKCCFKISFFDSQVPKVYI